MRERISKLLEEFHINQSAFAQKVGISKTMVSHVMSPSGRHSTFTENIIDKIILAFPNINKDWLMHGVGNMIIDSQHMVQPLQPSFDFSVNAASTDDKVVNQDVDSNTVSEPDSKPEPVSSTNPGLVNNSVAQQHVNTSVNPRPSRPQTSRTVNTKSEPVNSRKTVSRIVVFYNDGTFSEYTPDHSNY